MGKVFAVLIAFGILGLLLRFAVNPDGTTSSSTTSSTSSTTGQAAKPESPKDIEPPQPRPGQEVSAEYFKWLERKVGFDCQQKIKRGVEYNMRADGMMYGKNEMDSMNFLLRFNRSSIVVNEDNTIAIAGDKAEIQNQFGNWIRASYFCKVNIDTKTVINASVSSGRFSD